MTREKEQALCILAYAILADYDPSRMLYTYKDLQFTHELVLHAKRVLNLK